VGKIHKFQEYGVNERVLDQGDDEIAVLSNALDAGFAAIETRERERERFLAVAAHELKTPLTSVLGFSQAALEHLGDEAGRRRALDVLRRQASRMGRLVDELLLAASARAGSLTFHPKPVDLVVVLNRVKAELDIASPGRGIQLQEPDAAPALGDEQLLGHSFWSVLSYALSMMPNHPVVAGALKAFPAQWQFSVPLPGIAAHVEEWEAPFQPFGLVEYEGVSRPRNAVGLYLAREIARLHGGTLKVRDEATSGSTLVLELPK
jgi:signal transduction histidine kinase